MKKLRITVFAVVLCLISVCLLLGGVVSAQVTTFDPPGSTFTEARGINNAGQIVGWYIAGERYHGFLLSEGQFTTIDPPGSTWTQAFGINDAGQIVGVYIAAGRAHGFLYDPTI